jgi:thiamine biosynthesis protein ThiI
LERAFFGEGGVGLRDEVILATYSEIGLKSPPVRRHLESLLLRHIRKRLELKGLEVEKVVRRQGRLIVEGTDSLRGAEVVARVFGVASARPAVKIRDDLTTITQTVVDAAKEIVEPKQSFAIDARRTGKQLYTSKEIEVVAGDAVLKALSQKGVYVDLSHPDNTIYVEARGRTAYVYHRVFPGVAGLPFGSQGKVVSLFSGGIDSPVAAWLMMKRGCFVRLLFCDQRPLVGDDYYERALAVAGKIREYVPRGHYSLSVVPMGVIMQEIVDKVPPKLVCVCCKRMMYRLGGLVAEKIGAEGLVTGESLGQVASQTLFNLRVLDDVVSLPVYRPLISFEKLDIVRWAEHIGTYALSATSIHGCTALPKKPSTKAKLLDVKRVEERLNVQKLTSQAVQEMTRIPL